MARKARYHIPGAFYHVMLRGNYIHMNPVRAHLVKEPEAYRWSGHGAYLGQSEFVWLTTKYGLAKFANGLNEARLKYRDYVLRQESEEIIKGLRHGFSDGQILGDDGFLETVRETQNEASLAPISLQVILEATYQAYNIDQEALASLSRCKRLSLARGAATAFARKEGHTFEEIAKALKRESSSLSRLTQRFLQKLTCNIDIQNQYRLLEEIARRLAE